MFTRLRNRFLILNLVLITFIMLVAFASIYTITYQNVRRDIDMELHQVAEFYFKPDGKGSPRPEDGRGHPKGKFEQGPPPERSVSFSLLTDAEGAITSIDSRFEMDDEFYAAAVKNADLQSSQDGQFTLDGNRWAYLVQPNSSGYSVVFLDVTAQQKIVTRLIYTFLAVGLGMLVLIYFTSRFFANRSIAPVQEAFQRQKQFIADASHELKTPLAVINTNADVLLANSDDLIREQAKWLHRIKSETERMKTLTRDLLYLTEMDDARSDVLQAPFNASEAVESVILTMEAVVYEQELALDYKLEPNLMVYGIAEQLKQVVLILLDNAVKYTNPKGLITVTLSKRHHEAVLTVANTGEGIAPEHLERIFDRFYRTDPSRSRKHGGYGLGLAIAKSIVERHKGRITARSVPHEQTAFTVHLPLQ